MSKQYGFYLEVDNCVQCHACEVACKAANNVDLGVRWRRVISVWGGKYPDVTNKGVSLSCMHCGKAPCVEVCPTGALSKDGKTGAVEVDTSKCIGCHYCFFACPFGVPQFGADGTMEKCQICVEDLESGKEPPCVWTCAVDALHFGTLEELSALAKEKSGQSLITSG